MTKTEWWVYPTNYGCYKLYSKGKHIYFDQIKEDEGDYFLFRKGVGVGRLIEKFNKITNPEELRKIPRRRGRRSITSRLLGR